jgi:hypothetical protein
MHRYSDSHTTMLGLVSVSSQMYWPQSKDHQDPTTRTPPAPCFFLIDRRKNGGRQLRAEGGGSGGEDEETEREDKQGGKGRRSGQTSAS